MFAHTRYTVILIDLTVWPSDMELLNDSLEKGADMVHNDGHAILLVLYPVPMRKISAETLLKRQRLLEDRLMALSVTMGNKVCVYYDIVEGHGN